MVTDRLLTRQISLTEQEASVPGGAGLTEQAGAILREKAARGRKMVLGVRDGELGPDHDGPSRPF